MPNPEVKETTTAARSSTVNQPQAMSVMYNDMAGIKPPFFNWDDPEPGQGFKQFKRYCEL